MTTTSVRPDAHDRARHVRRPQVPVLMPRTATVGLLLVTLDVTQWITHGPSLRYAVVLALLTTTVFVDVQNTIRRGGVLITTPFILLACWLVALWFSAMAAAQWQPNTLIVIYSFLVLALGAATMWVPGRPRHERRRSRWDGAVYLAALLFGVVALGDALLGVPGSPVNLLSHERMFVAVYALSLPRRRYSWLVRVVVVTAVVVSILQYAAATTALVLLLAAAVAVIVRWSRHPVLLTLVAGLVATGLIASGAASAILTYFYAASGRVDNSSTRSYLWAQATEVIRQEPVAGGAARITITYLANIDGRISYAPIHNSFLTTMVVGGVVAGAILSLGLVSLALKGLSRPLAERRRVGVQWLPAFVAASMTMVVNPVIDKLGASLFLVVVTLAGLAAVTRAAPPGDDG